MKKKGLIISTIVMVIVLVASLTTATYAWFTSQTSTSIGGFNVQVTSNNAVKIGVSKTGTTVTSGLSEDSFVSGTVEYTAGTAGTFADSNASWGGDSAAAGLSATISHNIQWGAQSKAVGFSATANTNAVDGGLTVFEADSAYVYAANGKNDGSALVDQSAAVANNNGATGGDGDPITSDYVHLTLGVAPIKDLVTNQLVILVDTNTSGGKTLGIMAALHVAYKVTYTNTDTDNGGKANIAWKDNDVFSGSSYATTKTSVTDSDLSDAVKSAYQDTYDDALSVTTGVGVIVIDLGTEIDEIDQIELVIYLAGEDEDCNDGAVSNAGGDIKLFFVTDDGSSAT